MNIVLYASEAGPGVNKDAAYMMLKEGNKRFVSGTRTFNSLDKTTLENVSENGQHPFATVITCSDSRVPVEHIFDVGFGEVFTIRVAGNVCDVDEVASIEYGIEHLHTPVLVVLGHTQCGAVTAVAEGGEFEGSLAGLLDNITPAVEEVKAANPSLEGAELVDKCVEKNVWVSIEDLFKNSSAACELVKDGELMVVGGIYDLTTGEVKWLGNHPNEDKLVIAGNEGEHGSQLGHTGEALNKLKEGNERFVSGHRIFPNIDETTRDKLAVGGQHPFATVITCSDSRVPPEHLFDMGFGDIFVIRVAGNVCDTDEIASIEYGVHHLHTPVLVVLGHTQCGAVTAVAEEQSYMEILLYFWII